MKKSSGFTLMELLIVIVVLGVLAGVSMPVYTAIVWKARYAEVFSTVGAVVRAKKAYYAEHGNYGGDVGYTANSCHAGAGTSSFDHRVEKDLGIEIPQNAFFNTLSTPR
jgi:prepilin-type N-terminal cleavage/methylation domain-containing protein